MKLLCPVTISILLMRKLRQEDEICLAKIHIEVLLETGFKCRLEGPREQISAISEDQGAKDIVLVSSLRLC